MESPCFVTDIYLPNMLYALTMRSPVAKGRLKSVECPQLPDGYFLISAKDIPGKNYLDDTGLPILAADALSYIGEPAALLLGPDKNKLEEYSRRCKIIADEDVPVFSPGDAGPEMIAAQRDIRIGDPDAAFAQAAAVVRGSYSSGIQEHWYAEPTGAVAWPPDNANPKDLKLVVQTATQWPYHVRRSVAQVLNCAASKVLVKPAMTGMHMDGKLWYPSLISCHAALGAWFTGKPVRLILTREEDFSFSPKRCGAEISVASALDEKGRLTGVQIETVVNLGAHGVNADEILDHVNLGSLGVYKTKNIQLLGIALKTNIPPQGPFAGFGLAQGLFAMECHASCIAETLKQDPAQWRAENGIKNGILPFGLAVKDAPQMEQLVLCVVKSSDYRRKWASYELLRQSRRRQGAGSAQESPALQWDGKGGGLRGIGVALGYQGNGFLYPGADKGWYGIELTLEKNGSLKINTSMAGTGAHYNGLWAGIASTILGVEEGMVHINCGTEYPDAGPLSMSRNAVVLTKLVEQACMAISKKRFRDPLPISVRKMAHPQKNPGWKDFFPAENIDYSGFARTGWASAIVEVEIDPVECLPRIRGVWMGVDGGKIIAEDRAIKSLKDSAAQALGWAYREQINYVKGVIPADQFDNFDILGLSQIPPVNIEFINSAQDEPKGIGDLPFACIPSAYAQAVSQAMDHQFRSIPLKAVDIWYAGVKSVKEEAPE
ncbi:MAG: xanthine dehydrogenase family protein molybdopterin-binding subunit [Treponema sp.]|jgi:CO/xanthine dehydrogenase Mo-binding subunit|nr:xanthine dehydrogenase family protein molybdopterin-binding subunit [Treponema sp.]